MVAEATRRARRPRSRGPTRSCSRASRLQAERARGVRHPHRLADPARLRELDVDPVRALGAGGDVGERVAVLVDVDRDRRAALQLGAARVARGERLLAVLRRRARPAAAASSSASSSVQYSFTSTCSGRSVTRADGARRARRRGRRGRRASASGGWNRGARPLGAARHVVRVAEPDRPARSAGPRAAQPEQLPDRAGPRACRRGRAAPRRARPSPPARRAAGEPRADLARARTGRRRAASPRVVEERERGGRRSRRSARSAPPRRSPACRRARASTWTTSASSWLSREITKVSASRRVTIRALEPARRYTRPPRACSSGDRACASGAQGRRFDSYQAHSLCWARASRGPSSPSRGKPGFPVRHLAELTRVPRGYCSGEASSPPLSKPG